MRVIPDVCANWPLCPMLHWHVAGWVFRRHPVRFLALCTLPSFCLAFSTDLDIRLTDYPHTFTCVFNTQTTTGYHAFETAPLTPQGARAKLQDTSKDIQRRNRLKNAEAKRVSEDNGNSMVQFFTQSPLEYQIYCLTCQLGGYRRRNNFYTLAFTVLQTNTLALKLAGVKRSAFIQHQAGAK